MYDRACLGLSKEEVRVRMEAGEAHTIRFKMPTGSTSIEDAVVGHVTFPHSSVDDQVLMKSDGFPTYHLASVVDDAAMEITHVIRGQEWLASTPKHVALYKALRLQPPTFCHLPLLLNPDKTKLSKRHGDVAVEDFQAKGFLPEAINNFVALLGWNPKTAQDVFTMKELEQQFSLEHVNKANCVAASHRLEWLNAQHIKRAAEADPDRLLALALPFVQQEVDACAARAGTTAICIGDSDETRRVLGVSIQLQHGRATVLPDFGPLCALFFVRPYWETINQTQAWEDIYHSGVTEHVLASVESRLTALSGDEFEAECGKVMKAVAKANQLGMKKVLMPVRLVLTGMDVGAALGDIMRLLGREEVLARLALGSSIVLAGSVE